MLEYEPHGAAASLFNCRDELILISGPAGTGKSLAVLTQIYAVLSKYSRARGLLLRRTRRSQTQSSLVTFEQHVVPPGDPLIEGPSRACRHSYIFKNKSELVIAGLDSPESILSAEYDIVGIFQAEEIKESDLEIIRSRLRNFKVPYQQIIMDCNPSHSNHWLLKRDDITKFDSVHKDNPLYWDNKTKSWTEIGNQYVNGTLASLTGIARERFYKGLWTSVEGLVFPDWDPKIHVIPRPPIDKFKKIYASIDWGYRDPTVVQFWGVDSDNRIYLIYEIYETGLLMSDIIDRINNIPIKDSVTEFICDSAEPDKISELCKAGFRARPIKKRTILHGLDLVMDRLKVQGDGLPRLFVCENSLINEDRELSNKFKPTCFEQEITQYAWNDRKEEPIAENDHSCDACRYLCEKLDSGSGIYTPSLEHVEFNNNTDIRHNLMVRDEIWNNI